MRLPFGGVLFIHEGAAARHGRLLTNPPMTYQTKPSQKHINLAKEDGKSMMAMKITNDALFLDMMIQHHQHGIEMSQLAIQKAQGAQVKKLAQKFVADQKKDNNNITSGGIVCVS
jgi:uncharacterized protein (DUF305 family)